MKLLLVTSRFPYGPKEAFLTEEVAELARHFDVLVAPASPTSEPLAIPALCDVSIRLRLGSPRTLMLALAEAVSHPLAAIRAFASVVNAPRKISKRIKNAAIFPTALAVARLARRKGVDHVHGYWLSTPSTVAYVVSRLVGIPWSATGHRHDLVDFNVRTVGTPSCGFVRTAQFVRTISGQGASQLQHLRRAGVPLHVIHLGVRPEPVSERRRDGPFHLVCVANLERVKGHDTLLRALQLASRELPVRLTIIGDGTLRDELQAQADALAIDSMITFEGVVAHERLLERLASNEFHAAILTSVDAGAAQREGIPVFLMESMARGLPVIATRSGAVSELADDRTALLRAPGDVDGIAQAIVSLARDGALCDTLGAAGRERIAEEFDVRSCAATLAQAIGDKKQDVFVSIQGVEISA